MKTTYTTEEKQLIGLFRKGKLPMATFIVSHLFNGITDEELWKETPYGIEIDGVLYKRNDLQIFAREAETFLNNKLWKQTKKVLETASQRKMFNTGITENDLLFGRAMLYNIEVLEKFLARVSKL